MFFLFIVSLNHFRGGSRIFLGGGAPLRNDVTDRWGKQISFKGEYEESFISGGEGVRTPCTPPPRSAPAFLWNKIATVAMQESFQTQMTWPRYNNVSTNESPLQANSNSMLRKWKWPTREFLLVSIIPTYCVIVNCMSELLRDMYVYVCVNSINTNNLCPISPIHLRHLMQGKNRIINTLESDQYYKQSSVPNL